MHTDTLDITIGEDLYDPDPARYEPPVDPVSQALGVAGYSQDFVVDECVERFPAMEMWREPESFDRFYFPQPRMDGTVSEAVLVDIIGADDAGEREAERAAKHCAFKARWCLEHDRRYVVLADSDTWDPILLVALLAARPELAVSAPLVVPKRNAGKAPAAGRKAPARGKVQRPRAA